MSKLALSLAVGLALGLSAAALPALAQPAPGAAPGGAPPPPPPSQVSKDPAAAPAGIYKIDKDHQSVAARIAHGGGFSISVLRFGITDATLTWDPARIENSKVAVTIDMTPHTDPVVYRLSPAGPVFLDVAKFPTATFTSTSIKRTGPTSGQITGDLTLHGQTHPAVIDAQLVGAGKTGAGVPTIGFTGVMKIKRTDWGVGPVINAVGVDVELVIDGEFNSRPPA